MAERIESPRNPRVKEIVRLRTRSERDATGRFLVEGRSEVAKALDSGLGGTALYVGGEAPEDLALAEQAHGLGIPVIEVAATPFGRMAYRDASTGLILVADQFETSLDALPSDGDPLILVVEAIEKPGNLGTMLRTAEGAGVTAVVVCDPTIDLFNPNVVRASLGTLFWVPVAVASTPDTLAWLHDHGIRSVATTPSAIQLHSETDLRGPLAIVVGTEHEGLSEPWLNGANESVLIPMRGRGDSLNAAVSAAILLYEAVRQRSN